MERKERRHIQPFVRVLKCSFRAFLNTISIVQLATDFQGGGSRQPWMMRVEISCDSAVPKP
jgi:hypothetical protein